LPVQGGGGKKKKKPRLQYPPGWSREKRRSALLLLVRGKEKQVREKRSDRRPSSRLRRQEGKEKERGDFTFLREHGISREKEMPFLSAARRIGQKKSKRRGRYIRSLSPGWRKGGEEGEKEKKGKNGSYPLEPLEIARYHPVILGKGNEGRKVLTVHLYLSGGEEGYRRRGGRSLPIHGKEFLNSLYHVVKKGKRNRSLLDWKKKEKKGKESPILPPEEKGRPLTIFSM